MIKLHNHGIMYGISYNYDHWYITILIDISTMIINYYY